MTWLMALKARSKNLQVLLGPGKRNSLVDCPLAFINSCAQIHLQQLNNCGLISATCMIRSLILTSPTLLLMTYFSMQTAWIELFCSLRGVLQGYTRPTVAPYMQSHSLPPSFLCAKAWLSQKIYQVRSRKK